MDRKTLGIDKLLTNLRTGSRYHTEYATNLIENYFSSVSTNEQRLNDTLRCLRALSGNNNSGYELADMITENFITLKLPDEIIAMFYNAIPNLLTHAIEAYNYDFVALFYMKYEANLTEFGLRSIITNIHTDIHTDIHIDGKNTISMQCLMQLTKNNTVRIGRYFVNPDDFSREMMHCNNQRIAKLNEQIYPMDTKLISLNAARKYLTDDDAQKNLQICGVINKDRLKLETSIHDNMFLPSFNTTVRIKSEILAIIEKITSNDKSIGKYLSRILKTSLAAGSFGYIVSPAGKCIDSDLHKTDNVIGKLFYTKPVATHEINRTNLLTRYPGYDTHCAKYIGKCKNRFSEYDTDQLIYEKVGSYALSFLTSSSILGEYKTVFGGDAGKIYENRFGYLMMCINSVFDGINFFVENRLIHGDLHTGNIMISYNTLTDLIVPKIIDYGGIMTFDEISSRIIDTTTQSFMIYANRIPVFNSIKKYIESTDKVSEPVRTDLIKKHLAPIWSFIDLIILMYVNPKSDRSLQKMLTTCMDSTDDPTKKADIKRIIEYISNIIEHLTSAYDGIIYSRHENRLKSPELKFGDIDLTFKQLLASFGYIRRT
jgi:hypothetical protein